MSGHGTVNGISVRDRTCPGQMDLADIKRWARNWPITYDHDHFPQRARERDRSAEWIVEHLKDGNITGVEENP